MPRYAEELLNEAKKLGYDERDLNKYYNHGLTAWVDHKIPGTTPEQLGIALVEEFVSSERTRNTTVRKDLIVEQEAEVVGLKKLSQMPRNTVVEDTLYTEEFLDALPNDETIIEWATSEQILGSYAKRYGKNAPQKLIEAANLFVRKSDWQAPEEPSSNHRPGTKRHSWEMKTWHEEMFKLAKEENLSEAVEFHAEKIEEYTRKTKR
jgi:hypothetical protein